MSGPLQDKKIVIAGGSGFIGVSLAHHLAERGASVVILSRSRPKVAGPWRHSPWDCRTLGPWRDELNKAAELVNLAGRSVTCIKTPDHQDEILRSRVESTRVLGVALRIIDSPPPTWVQMSTAHIYGDPPTEICSEESAFGYGLAPYVGCAWEEAFRENIFPTQRGVVLRTGFVLGRNRGAGGGALEMLVKLARAGLGGRVGSGKQGISWIHETDLNRLIERGLTDPRMEGAYVASTPHPVSQTEFSRELRRVLRIPIGLPAAAWMVRFGARFFLRSDPELALIGRYVISKRLDGEDSSSGTPTSAMRSRNCSVALPEQGFPFFVNSLGGFQPDIIFATWTKKTQDDFWFANDTSALFQRRPAPQPHRRLTKNLATSNRRK